MSTLPLFGPKGGAGGRGAHGNAGGRRGAGGGDTEERVYRVGQLNRIVRLQLEDRFRNVWVQGELTDVSRPSSGHVYFTLNDEEENAQVRGVMFRSDAQRAKAKLENGARVKLRGTLSLFEPRGSYQLIARLALPFGLGDLQAQFEAVRRRLDEEGLLAPERKRPLPSMPGTVGVVTSRTGAALHDIVVVSQQRCPTRLVVAPCVVQGAEAPLSIVAALQMIQTLPDLSVVIVGRGGGASEDLVAFNDERVARAIAGCRVPTISAVGHEIDVTIADLVADVRAATPSNAAELAVPDRRALLEQLDAAQRRLAHAMRMRLAHARLAADQRARRLRDPRLLSARNRRELDRLSHSLGARLHQQLRLLRRHLAEREARLRRHNPRLQTARQRATLNEIKNRLERQQDRLLVSRRARLAELAARLSSLSPLSVLARGYAIALREDGRALLRADDAKPNERLQLRLHKGQLWTRVEP